MRPSDEIRSYATNSINVSKNSPLDQQGQNQLIHQLSIESIQVQTLLVAWSALWTQAHYEAPEDLWVKQVSKCSDDYQISEAVPSILAQSWSWPWGCQVADQKRAEQGP